MGDEWTESIQLFRIHGTPTHYPDVHPPISYDLTLCSIVVIFLALALIVFLVSPGYQNDNRWCMLSRNLITLWIGFCILVCNFSYGWSNDEVIIMTKLTQSVNSMSLSKIGLHIGLRGFNITLTGIMNTDFQRAIDNDNDPLMDAFHYNEHISWAWKKSKGSQLRQLHEEYSNIRENGVPLPIQWITEYFALDGGYFNFGRSFRDAGWYTHIICWIAFVWWILANIMVMILVQYVAVCLSITGVSLLFANLIYYYLTKSSQLRIPFQSPFFQPHFLAPTYGWSFYLNILNGIFCLTVGLALYISDVLYPEAVSEYFGLDIARALDDHLKKLDEETFGCTVNKPKSEPKLEEVTKGDGRIDQQVQRLTRDEKDNFLSETHPRTFGAGFSYGVRASTLRDRVNNARISRMSRFVHESKPPPVAPRRLKQKEGTEEWFAAPRKRLVQPRLSSFNLKYISIIQQPDNI